MILFDIETTGLTSNDKIWEIYALKINSDKSEEELYFKFNPEKELSLGAFEKTGYTLEKLQGEPLFSKHAKKIYEFFQGHDIAGYNVAIFDMPFLQRELANNGYNIDFSQIKIYDAYRNWVKNDKRTLTDAYKFYLKSNMDEKYSAHSAKDDVLATREILREQANLYNVLTEYMYDPDGFFIYIEKENKITLKRGKHRNKTLFDILIEDPNYFDWVINESDFHIQTKNYFETFRKMVIEKSKKKI